MSEWLLLLAALLSTGCGASTTPASASDAAATEATTYLSCAYTGEPAQPPCTQYLGLRGNLAACGILDASAPGALSAAVCLANCVATDQCSLVLDASVAPGIGTPGYPYIACGCR